MSNPKQPVSSKTKDSELEFDINESAYKTSHTAVRKARRFAMQGLYEWLMTDRRFEQTGHREWKSNAPHDIAARTRASNAMHTVHLGYYHEMMRHIPEQVDALDALIAQHLDREISDLDTVEHAILLIGTYELKDRFEIPYKVVLDEAMKLNTHFGATDAHKLINAVLDKLAPELRAAEVAADAKLPKESKKVSPEIPEYDEPLIDSEADKALVEGNAESASLNTEQVTLEETPKREPKPRIGLKSGQSANRKRVAPSSSNSKEKSAETLPEASADVLPELLKATSIKSALAAAGAIESRAETENSTNPEAATVKEASVSKDVVSKESATETEEAAAATNVSTDANTDTHSETETETAQKLASDQAANELQFKKPDTE